MVVVGDARRLRKGAAAAGVGARDRLHRPRHRAARTCRGASCRRRPARRRTATSSGPTQLAQDRRGRRDLHRAAEQGGAAPRRPPLPRPHRAARPPDRHPRGLDDARHRAGCKVIHVTTHVGLLDAIERIEPGLVEPHDRARATRRSGRPGSSARGSPSARSTRTPGEGGLFGRGEEEAKIAPAIEAARADGIDAHGPRAGRHRVLPRRPRRLRPRRGHVPRPGPRPGQGARDGRGREHHRRAAGDPHVASTTAPRSTSPAPGKADPSSLLAALRAAAELAG